ncbi:hypothetical protein Adt_45489 [Abeliophyllum distichum]|uniref:Uncharacterized protein n=1 Tax=Abeliophyllum distichum TaxID=126358 RepID=A0ABD1PG99_9LAMI
MNSKFQAQQTGLQIGKDSKITTVPLWWLLRTRILTGTWLGFTLANCEFDFLVQLTARWRRHRLQYPVQRSLNRIEGLGQKNGGGGRNVVRRDGAITSGGDDGGFCLAEKPLNGLPVGAVAKFPCQLEHPSGAQSRYSHAAATAIDFSVSVLGGQRRPICSS